MNYRNIFISPPGKLLVVADFMGQELRGLAEVTRDKELINAFKNNYDLHLLTANKLFNLDLDNKDFVEGSEANRQARAKYSRERHIGKNGANFPIIYGSTAWGVSKNLGISEKESQGYIDGFFELYPGVKECMGRVSKLLHRQKYVVNKTGRLRRFGDYITKRNQRQAFNFLIQGMSADITKAAAVAVRELCKMYNEEYDAGAKLLILVHDEIVVEIKEEFAGLFMPAMKRVMEQAYKIVVALPVEVGCGKKYGDIK